MPANGQPPLPPSPLRFTFPRPFLISPIIQYHFLVFFLSIISPKSLKVLPGPLCSLDRLRCSAGPASARPGPLSSGAIRDCAASNHRAPGGQLPLPLPFHRRTGHKPPVDGVAGAPRSAGARQIPAGASRVARTHTTRARGIRAVADEHDGTGEEPMVMIGRSQSPSNLVIFSHLFCSELVSLSPLIYSSIVSLSPC